MSLNWNAKEAPRWDELEDSKKESVIFATMAVDIGEITESNVQKFYKRYVMFYATLGMERYLTAEDVTKAIGLRTNVFTTTDAAYKKRLYGILDRNSTDVVREAFQEVS